MNTPTKRHKQPDITPEQKRLIEHAAKKIVKNYGKTLKLLAKE